MAYPVVTTPFPAGSANPLPPYSGTFIPEIWSGKLIEKFYDYCVLAAISNTDYEGEIKNQGDKVIIRTRPTITIRNYEANQSLLVERPSSDVVTLLIDQGKYFNTILDDVMRVQSDLNQMDMWSDDAAQQMKIVIDTEVLLYMVDKAVTDNRGATAGRISNVNLGTAAAPIAVTKDNILDLIVDLGLVLDEQNIPETNRWVVMPAAIGALIKKSDLRDASITGDGTSVLRNGRLGMIDRFTLYTSNLLPRGTTIPGAAAGVGIIYAGTSHALTFASQVSVIETLRSESTFGNLLRGLQVYGRQVIDGKALTQALVTLPAGTFMAEANGGNGASAAAASPYGQPIDVTDQVRAERTPIEREADRMTLAELEAAKLALANREQALKEKADYEQHYRGWAIQRLAEEAASAPLTPPPKTPEEKAAFEQQQEQRNEEALTPPAPEPAPAPEPTPAPPPTGGEGNGTL